MICQETTSGREPDPHRRALLAGLAAAYLTWTVAPAHAQAASDQDAFLAVSRFLTGRPSLDPGQAARLHEAFVADAPRFGDELRALLRWIEARGVEADRLQTALDAEGSALATLPRRVMTAWYAGVVGQGAGARCVTFETSLMHQAVADRLNPPSYCLGPHASWSGTPA